MGENARAKAAVETDEEPASEEKPAKPAKAAKKATTAAKTE